LRTVVLSFAVAAALVSAARAAEAQPSLHAALGVGAGYTPFKSFASFRERDVSPIFTQIEAGGSLGPLGTFAHAAHLTVLTGLSEGLQLGVMPSYLLYRRSSLKFASYLRVGFPIMFLENTQYGLEGGLAGIWFLTSGIGIVGEVDGDYYKGTEREIVLGGHLGAFVSYEVLPE
jgi:hypothetical protein